MAADKCRATDVDVEVILYAVDDETGQPFDLTGATVQCFIRTPDRQSTSTVDMSIILPGSSYPTGNISAHFFTVIDTFPIGGIYTVQLFATFTDGRTRRGEELDWPVGFVLG